MDISLADWSSKYEDWQCFQPLSTHLLSYCLIHTVYDVLMWSGWELVSHVAADMRVDEVAFLTWNVVSFILNLAGGVFSLYFFYIDFHPSFLGMHTWTTMFFAFFIVDMMFIVKQRLYFKKKILRFLVFHHVLTFGVCILSIAAFTAPQFLGPPGKLLILPTLWNASSAISNALFIFRLLRGVGKVDATLLRVTTLAFVVQRTWRLLSYAVVLYHQPGMWAGKLVIMSPGFIMDTFDSMSQWTAIKLIRKKLREEIDHQSTSRALLARLRDEQASIVYDQSRSPTPSPTVAKRRMSLSALAASPPRTAPS